MAEVKLATAFIQPACDVVRCSWGPIARRINYARKLSKNWEVFCKKSSELCSRRNDIDTEIERSKPEKTSTNECKDWKRNVMEMENWIEATKPEFDIKKKCIGGLCPDIFARILLGERILNMISEIKELMEKAKFENGFLIDSPPVKVEKMSDPDFNLSHSAYNILERVWNKVQNKSTPKVGIWGMGGIGKTTIMQLLNNKLEISAMFDFVIWVTVSKSRSIRNLQEEVGKRLSMEIKIDESEESVASKLLVKLKGNKYLLLLDDVWEKVNLSRVGFPNPNQDNGCKVVLTTRKLDVCRKMRTDFQINVKGLTEGEAWEFFSSEVGDVAESETIRPFAKQIVRKCDGLPLALKVVGGALREVENSNVWNNFLNKLNSPSTSSIEDVDDEVFKLLQLSYDQLKDVKKK